jgi:DNA-binding response OmpR family regulator
MTALILDDNLMFAMSLEGALRRCGYAPRTLAPGRARLEDLAADLPDLLLVNLTAAAPGGAAFIRSVREHPDLMRLPILGYAGHVETAFLHAGTEAGADVVAPNSAVTGSLPEVLRKVQRVRSEEPDVDSHDA